MAISAAPEAPSVHRPRRRLLLSLYLVGVGQIALTVVSIGVVHRLFQRSSPEWVLTADGGRLDSYAEFFDTPATLARLLAKLADFDLSFYQLDGQPVASTRNVIPPLGREELSRLLRSTPLMYRASGALPITASLVVRDGSPVGYGLAHRRFPGRLDAAPPPRVVGPPLGSPADAMPDGPPPPFAPPQLPVVIACTLLAVAVISFLFARSLARPLAKLAEAAQAFGAGDLQARARIRRNDEVGTVARTFDEMAERVNALLNAQREFLANVSHELKTPLARIRVALELADDDDLNAVRRSLQLIAQDWGDLDRLVDDVLTVARFDLAQDARIAAVQLNYERIDVRALAERVAAGFRSLHRHRFEVVVHEAAAQFYGDATLLRRVLDNLLHNAGKYSDANTIVRLEIRQRGSDIEFSVLDHGIGIDAADLPRLFEPFFRSDRSRARKTGGVGLGLALAKRIVEAHHGRILVRSEAGAGTTVAFTIPVEPPDDTTAA